MPWSWLQRSKWVFSPHFFNYQNEYFSLSWLIVTGYRSPSRPIPKDAIPDDTILFNFGSHNVGGSADENLEHQLVQNGQEHMKFYSDESITDSCRKDGWWIEAIRAAEKIENMPRTLDLTETVSVTSSWVLCFYALINHSTWYRQWLVAN